jgi:hypothetical protein
MKTPTVISAAALLGSGIAIVLAARHPAAPTQAEIDARVDARLAARELRLVESIAPKFKEMYAEMGDPDFGSNWSPKTLEELVAPLLKVITAMEEPAPDETDNDDQGAGDKPTN